MFRSLCRGRGSRLIKNCQTTRRSIFIETESTPNPNSIKFLPGQEVLPELYGTGREFQRTQHREFQCCPLAISIFDIDGINGVYLGRDFISVTKAADYQWNILKPQVFWFLFLCIKLSDVLVSVGMYIYIALLQFFIALNLYCVPRCRFSRRYLTSFRRKKQSF